MQYKVMINEFEGPLDLLLHLIKENDIDIYNISIKEITKQYLDYIETMKNLSLSVASEYLVMASELLEIKSKMLLPKKEKILEEEFEEDPREVLIEKLISYKQYKEISSKLKALEEDRQNILTKQPENISKFIKYDDYDNSQTLNDLLEAFSKFLNKKQLEKPIKTKITEKEISIFERVKKIRNILQNRKKMSFDELIISYSKKEVIVNFLSILEMAKKDEIIISQEDNFNKIFISLKEGE